MAISIQRNPYTNNMLNLFNRVAPVFTPCVYVLSSDNSAEINFRYVADVYIKGDFKVRLNFTNNSNNRGIIDVQQIIQDYCKAQVSGYRNGVNQSGSSKKANVSSVTVQHSIHQIDKWSRNDNTMIDIQLKFGESFSTAVGFPPITYTGVGAAKNTPGEPAKEGLELQVFNSALWQFKDLQRNNDTLESYYLTAGNKNLLSTLDASIKRKIRLGDYHTIAMFNGTNRASVTSLTDRVNFRFYDSGGNQLLFTQILNNDNFGGSPYGTTSNNGVENLLFLGCGTKNFTNHSINPIPAATSYYTVQVVQGGAGRSKTYTFEIDNCDEDTERFKTFRLGWLNSLGGFDYYNFTMKNEKSFDFDRQTFMKTVGTWQDLNYTFEQGDHGVKDLNVDAVQKLNLQTDWLVDGEVEMMRECFMSPMVWMLEGEDVFPVNVQSTNFIEYNQKNDKVFQYELDVTFSHKHRIQNG